MEHFEPAEPARPKSFAEFYPFYLAEHQTRACRRAHFIGSSLGLASIAAALAWREPWLVLIALVCGYAGAWLGHFVFEKNRPATFRYPLWSFCGDWVMYRDMLLGRLTF